MRGTLTARKALLITEQMWGWIAKGLGRSKFEWPGWLNNGGKVPPMHQDCALCEYVYQVGGRTCFGTPETGDLVKLCPLKSLWPKGCAQTGPFKTWVHSHNDTKAQNSAAIIRDGATKALAKLKEGEKA